MGRSHLITVACTAAVAVAALAGAAPVAHADIGGVFGKAVVPNDPNGPIPCVTKSDGTRFCIGSAGTSVPGGGGNSACAPGALPVVGGSCLATPDPSVADTRVPSFDGTPLDVNVTLPPAPARGSDGDFPLVILLHGYGGAKKDPDAHEADWLPTAHEWAKMGYAVVNMSDRGFGESCGSAASRLSALATAAAAGDSGYGSACQRGWVKLLDMPGEVHDAQHLAGLLVDEGVVDPHRIGAAGESYGGGASLDLASLKDRVMNVDGSVVPWTSPVKHIPLSLAGATPTIPWSDLISSLAPNGSTLDYAIEPPDYATTPIGIEKQSFVAGLYALGEASGYYAPPGADPHADLTPWFTATNLGEPYESDPIVSNNELPVFKSFKGAYYVLDGTSGNGSVSSEAPAPLLLSNGFTDDLFPVDETVRYYNLERSLYPHDPVSLMYFDYGHQRGQNKAADVALLEQNIVAWFDHYVRGDGPNPGRYVEALTQTCGQDAAGKPLPSGGPFLAGSWAGLHPGELDYGAAAAQTVLSTGGDPSIAQTFDPITGSGACATAAATPEPNTATYDLPAASGGGYTLLGAPTITADLQITGQFPELALRLLDVDPSGTETLVARGIYRPAGSGSQITFQLHPGSWHFAAGHHPRLELLGRDVPYARPSNGIFQIAVSNLTLRLPTRETSGNGIRRVGPLPLPAGLRPAPGVATFTVASSRVGARKHKPSHKKTHKHGRRG